MFERWLSRGAAAEQKEVLAAEERQKVFSREQTSHTGAMHPSDDHTYLAIKEERKDNIRWTQDLNDELENLKHSLRREVQNADKQWVPQRVPVAVDGFGHVVYKDMAPLMNELGINMIQEELRPLMSRNMINSNYDEERILRILRNTIITVTMNLAYNYDAYGIDMMQYGHINRLILNSMYPAPYRALNNGERRATGGILKRVETFNEAPQQKEKRGVFG